MDENQLGSIAPALLDWYYGHRRILPFREDPTPYHIWVSEIMLQQTRVSAVLPYYERFITELPSVAALAACDQDRLHKLWQGLGYYNRVRNMQKAAQIVVEQYGGEMPGNYEALLALPGIGEYTAGAIASIAFGLPEVAVDGNVLRVFSRLLNSDADIMKPQTKKILSEEVRHQLPQGSEGDFNQALMELGALVCVPGTPSCEKCPVQELCIGHKKGRQAELPVRAAKKPPKVEELTVLVVYGKAGVLLHKRPDTGLLAGLYEPILCKGYLSEEEAQKYLHKWWPDAEVDRKLPAAKHVFTHRIWQMRGWLCHIPQGDNLPAGCVWATMEELETTYSVPGAYKAYLPYMQ